LDGTLKVQLLELIYVADAITSRARSVGAAQAPPRSSSLDHSGQRPRNAVEYSRRDTLWRKG
jgi:hypothetical protein